MKEDMCWKTSRGSTLMEMVIVVVILSTLSAITIYFLVNSLKVYTMTINQKTLLDEAKLSLERMCRDIRDARSISVPSPGNSNTLITFKRANVTAYDSADENITFRNNGGTLEKVKASPAATSALARDVATFTVTRGATNDEITLILTLSLGTGENVTLQTKVYPKNLIDSAIYKTFFTCWKEELSS